MINNYNQIELHYFFSDDSHGFDALIRNESERELLYLFQEVSSDLDIKLLIEAKPPQNGGFVEIWEFVSTNKEMITLLVSVLTLIMSRVPVLNRRLTQLQIENLELDNKLKKDELNKLGIKNSATLDDDTLGKAIVYLFKNYKTIWRRSNFFKIITEYKRINKISVNKLYNFTPSPSPQTLVLGDFEQFILFDEKIPDIKDQLETIDLISSALKPGKRLNQENFDGKAF